MKISEFEKNYVFTTKVNLTEDGKEWVLLKEPSQHELFVFQSEEKNQEKAMQELFIKCAIDTTLVNDEGEPVLGRQLYDVLAKSGTQFAELVSNFFEALPFASKTEKKDK